MISNITVAFEFSFPDAVSNLPTVHSSFLCHETRLQCVRDSTVPYRSEVTSLPRSAGPQATRQMVFEIFF